MTPAGPAPLIDDDLLLVGEVATELRVAKMTVYRLVRAGTLEAIRVGRSIRIPRRALTAHLRQSRFPTGPSAP
jgi:excisionase family DNA binding protein